MLDPTAKGVARMDAGTALARVLAHRVWVDQRRGWRFTNPNLEELGLVEAQYPPSGDLPRISPINQGLLSWPEIRRCEASSAARLEKRVAFIRTPELTTAHPPSALLTSRFHAARLAEVYLLTNSRNAWHSTPISQYFQGAISGSEAVAKARAERLRTQGSGFFVERIPALVLQSDGLTLIGVEVNFSREHRRHAEVFDGPLTARRILDEYAVGRRNTVLWLHAAGNYRFDTWKSASAARWRSSPGSYWLSWRRLEGSASPASPTSGGCACT
jgi:hypothetical protein